MVILVTGGAGYIGSHTCLELLQAGYEVVVFDNLSNGHLQSLYRIEQLTSRSFLKIIQQDIRNEAALTSALQTYNCKAVIHFAALKSVIESISNPLQYYDNNVNGTLCLLRAMKASKVKTLVFSSSACIYGEPQNLPLQETHPLSPTNPYGKSKHMVEEILRGLFFAEPEWRIGILRYFNPVGAHESGLVGEDPGSLPTNLMPFITQVAIGKREKLQVWGGDYPTHDGTGIRDYIHVMDIAQGHLKTLEYLKEPQCVTINLGRGTGYSVLEVIRTFEKISGCAVPYVIEPRRPGDIAISYSAVALAKQLLSWQAERDLERMCQDSWNWQQKNPNGYS